MGYNLTAKTRRFINNSKNNFIGFTAFIIVFATFATLAPQAVLAQSSINQVTLNGGVATTTLPGAEVTVQLQVESASGSGDDHWHSIGYQVGEQAPVCQPTLSFTGAGEQTTNFSLLAPQELGSYDVTLRAYRDDNCSVAPSSILTLSKGITVWSEEIEGNKPEIVSATLLTNPVSPGGQVEIKVEVKLSGPGTQWRHTGINGDINKCLETPTRTGAGLWSNTLSLGAPSIPGSYSLAISAFHSSSASMCNSNAKSVSMPVELVVVGSEEEPVESEIEQETAETDQEPSSLPEDSGDSFSEDNSSEELTGGDELSSGPDTNQPTQLEEPADPIWTVTAQPGSTEAQMTAGFTPGDEAGEVKAAAVEEELNSWLWWGITGVVLVAVLGSVALRRGRTPRFYNY